MALFVLLAAILPSVLAKFTNPPDIIRGTFHLGDRETIKYDTSFNNYTIALWQQAPQGGAAKLGPILFETTNGPNSSFDWLVQAYDFNIDDSPTFFMWLFVGNASSQGKTSIPNMVSSYFTIAEAKPSTTSSLISSSTSSTSVASSSSTSSASPSGSSSTNPAVQETSSGSGGLSVGASAGIGVGVGVGVIAAAVTLGLVFWRRHQKQKQQSATTRTFQGQNGDVGEMSQGKATYYSPNSSHMSPYYHQPAISSQQSGPHTPQEMPNNLEVVDNRHPAELG